MILHNLRRPPVSSTNCWFEDLKRREWLERREIHGRLQMGLLRGIIQGGDPDHLSPLLERSYFYSILFCDTSTARICKFGTGFMCLVFEEVFYLQVESCIVWAACWQYLLSTLRAAEIWFRTYYSWDKWEVAVECFVSRMFALKFVQSLL